MIHSPHSSEAANTGQSCARGTVIPAQGPSGQEAKPEARAPFTASAFAASLLRGALLLILFVTVLRGTCAAAEKAGGLGTPPRSPLAARAPSYARDWQRASVQPAAPWMLAEVLPSLGIKDVGMLIIGLFGIAMIYRMLSGAKGELAKEVAAVVIAQLGESSKAGHSEMTLAGQPIQVEGVVRFVAHHELDERLNGYVTGDDLHAAVQRLDEKQEANFRSLDQKRSHSIGNLHEHLTGTTKSLTEKIEHASGRQHDRMEAMSNALRGEFEAKLTELRADLGNLPGRVITLLQQTGQIGRGGKS